AQTTAASQITKQSCPSAGLQPRNHHAAGADIREVVRAFASLGPGLKPSGAMAPAVGCWLLAVGYWLLAIGYWLLAIGYWLLAAPASPLLPTPALGGMRGGSPAEGQGCFVV
ncbi:MAG: hypothetical protein E2587_16145, partial [Delftia sp.]|nr:hypothetical protein [Delftia sp.]